MDVSTAESAFHDDAGSLTVGAGEAAFVVERGQWVVFVHHVGGRQRRRISEARDATAEEFTVVVPSLPAWLAPGAVVDAEVRHDDGTDLFSTRVLRCDDAPSGHLVILRQPARSWHHDQRSARRIDVDVEVRFSQLDDTMHPGPEFDASVSDLSVTGMRLEGPTPALEPGRLLVASLRLSDGWVNVVSEVVARNRIDGATRLAFRRLPDADRRRLLAELARWSNTPAAELVSPQVLRPGPPRHVVEAYTRAGADRRS